MNQAKTYLKLVIFTLILVGFFVWVGEILTRISGGGGAVGGAVGVNPEAGENIFWGKGKCGTCHSIGNRGSAVRGPNLGEGKDGPIIAVRAEKRAKERAEKGVRMSATEYLIESIADTGAYVVEGFKNEMPLAYQPPIALSPDEIKAAISYLQSLGGEVDIAAIKLPDVILKASAEPVEPWKPYIEGDVEAGEYLFFDEEGNAACSKCHIAIDSSGTKRGGKVGPDLTTVAGTRTPQFIVESILNPNKEIASGYEQILIVTADGRYIDGIPQREDETSVVLAKREGTDVIEITIPKSDIAQREVMKTSMMPSNISEILTIQEFHDIVAYVLTLNIEY